MSTLFVVSGGVAGMSCGIVGLSFLGISLNLKGKQALKEEKVVGVIAQELKRSTLNVQRRKKVKTPKTANLEISEVENATIKEPKEISPKIQKRKAKARKVPDLHMTALGLVEEEKVAQKI
jgi:hypothetical protein